MKENSRTAQKYLKCYINFYFVMAKYKLNESQFETIIANMVEGKTQVSEGMGPEQKKEYFVKRYISTFNELKDTYDKEFALDVLKGLMSEIDN